MGITESIFQNCTTGAVLHKYRSESSKKYRAHVLESVKSRGAWRQLVSQTWHVYHRLATTTAIIVVYTSSTVYTSRLLVAQSGRLIKNYTKFTKPTRSIPCGAPHPNNCAQSAQCLKLRLHNENKPSTCRRHRTQTCSQRCLSASPPGNCSSNVNV